VSVVSFLANVKKEARVVTCAVSLRLVDVFKRSHIFVRANWFIKAQHQRQDRGEARHLRSGVKVSKCVLTRDSACFVNTLTLNMNVSMPYYRV